MDPGLIKLDWKPIDSQSKFLNKSNWQNANNNKHTERTQSNVCYMYSGYEEMDSDEDDWLSGFTPGGTWESTGFTLNPSGIILNLYHVVG